MIQIKRHYGCLLISFIFLLERLSLTEAEAPNVVNFKSLLLTLVNGILI